MKAYSIKCRISNTADATRVDVYDDIGDDFFTGGISASDFAANLATVKGALEVHINSGGGNVFHGVAIADAIRSHKGRVVTVVDGVAASIASVIAQAGQERIMAPGSMIMIHDASGFCDGNAADMAKTAEVLSKVSDSIAGQYAKRAGGTKEEWRQAMQAESWYTDEEAVAAGLADSIGEGPACWPASLDLAAFSSVPGRIAASVRRMPTQVADGKSADIQPQDAEKYSTDDRKQMASKGQALDDGSYPIADEEDLHNAIHAVGRGGADHNAIRKHIIKRAAALGKSSAIPDNWNADGSTTDGSATTNQFDPVLLSAALASALKGGLE